MVHANISTSSAISSMSGLVSFYSRGLRACMHLHACIIMLARPTASVAGMREHSRSLLSRKGVACPMLYINYFKTHTCRSLPGLMGHGSAKRLAKFSSDLHSITFAATCGVIAYRLRELDKLSSCLPSWIAWQVQVSFADMQIASVYVCIYIYIYVCVCVCRVSYTLPAVGNSIL